MDNANFDNIRFLKADRMMEFRPVDDWQKPLTWESATGEQIGACSGVAYFFAKKIHQETGIPIGIIDASWGGTMIETWMSDIAISPFNIYNFELDILRSRQLPLRETDIQAKAAFEKWKESDYKQGVGFDERWYERQSDLSDWLPIEVPGYWEDQLPEFADFDGAMWYRKSFDVPKQFLPYDILMWLSQIDDHNICWINGQYIGETYLPKTWTSYLVPSGILKEKDNEIVLRVFDVEGKGGLIGLDSYFDFYPVDNDSIRARLNGTWLVRPGTRYNSGENENISFIGDNPNYHPTLLYNGMVHPFGQFSMKGVIWYQGEANRKNAYAYRYLFPALILDWRTLWNDPTLPFYFVQIANYGEISNSPASSEMAELRESQFLTAKNVSFTGMAVTIDIGDSDDIHPRNKKEVGDRLARHALKNDYKKAHIITDGPIYKKHFRDGNKIIVEFDNSEGLSTDDGLLPLGFEIASEKGDFLKAYAVIKKNIVEVSHPDVKNPMHVRYAWADSPVVNLCNGEKLPAYPFRTDTRALITQGRLRNYK